MRISVCIPTYNQSLYIGDTLKSVLNQSLLPDEIIVANDASTDNTKEVVEQFAAAHPLIQVIHQEKNLGLSANIDFAVRKGTGDFIVTLHSDDILLPHFIARLSALLIKYPAAGYAHANSQEINETGTVTRLRLLYRKEEFIKADKALVASLKGYRVAANIIMFRKEALQKVGYIQSMQNFAEDFFLSVAIADAGFGNVFCNQILSQYRVWSDSGQVRQKRKIAELKGLQYVFEKAIVPAFIRCHWSLQEVNKARESFAARQANCLSWNIYSEAEKQELETAILALSSTKKVKRLSKMYRSGYGGLLNKWNEMKINLKTKIKQYLRK